MGFIFKDQEDYKNQRNALLDDAETAIAAGDLDQGNQKMKDVEAMDAAFDRYAKAKANMSALKDVKPSSKLVKEGVIDIMGNNITDEDMYNSRDYRMAFMNHVLAGKPIPEKFLNEDQVTKTTDAGAVIPTTIMEKIIEKMEATGMILPLVTRTGYKGGVSIPTSTVKPVASWVSEGTGSDKQKKTLGSVTFAYHKLRCAVAITLETATMALPVFETTLINNVSEAMIKALEQAIIDGDGSGKPKGILAETPNAGQALEIAEGDGLTYETLCNMEAALPLEYESGAVWLMTKKTFMAFASMTDTNGQPIARVNYGIGGRPERTLLGRAVIVNNYMSNYGATVTADTVCACLFNMPDYVLNTNLEITIKKYEDNDTDDQVTKAVMLVDGKVVDKGSLVTLTIKNS